MASVYTNDLRLEEIGSGEQSGTWGNTTNTNLELIAEGLSFGTEAITTNANTHASTVADGATDPARSMYIKYTGALDSDCTITIGPDTISRMHFIENATTDSGSSGPYNIIIKQGSGATITIPNGNVKAVYLDGAGSGAAVVDAFASLNVGALSTQTAGTDNVRLGEGAGDSIASGGNNNVVIGKDAGTALTTGDNNVAIGYEALKTEDADSNTVAVGYQALATQNAGSDVGNTAVGTQAGTDLTNGSLNTFVGRMAGAAVTTHSNNVAIGAYAMDEGVGDHNIAIGSGALGGSSLASGDNVAIGTDTLNNLTSGTENVVIGRDAGKALTTGSNNVVLGNDALVFEDAHGKNVAIGWSTLKNLDTGATGLDGENVAVGYDAGRNTALGVNNTFLGSQAGQANSNGDANTFIGRGSGSTVTTGDNNTILGPFNGNQDSLDIRTSDHSIVLSSGDGSVRFYYVNSGNYWNLGTRNGNVVGNNVTGFNFYDMGFLGISRDGGTVLSLNRKQDGDMMEFKSQGATEGSISISGSTTSFNGGHLSRWSRLESNNKDTSIVKGTVMTNLDKMVVWHHEAIEAKDAERNEKGNIVTEAVEAKDAWTEENEQLNCMAVSSVEGDPNVAGVFVNWDEDDDFNDMNVAMTGDMVIRIAKGVTVARGDLLMSAGDGTAKPQGDDIVRSKTIAKVTSTNVSHTYDDESFCVPCVLMAC